MHGRGPAQQTAALAATSDSACLPHGAHELIGRKAVDTRGQYKKRPCSRVHWTNDLLESEQENIRSNRQWYLFHQTLKILASADALPPSKALGAQESHHSASSLQRNVLNMFMPTLRRRTIVRQNSRMLGTLGGTFNAIDVLITLSSQLVRASRFQQAKITLLERGGAP